MVQGTNSDRDRSCHREPAPSAGGFSPTHMKQLHVQRLYIVFTWNEIPWLHKKGRSFVQTLPRGSKSLGNDHDINNGMQIIISPLIYPTISRHNLHLPAWTQTLPHVKDVACKARNQLCITAAQQDLTHSWKGVT